MAASQDTRVAMPPGRQDGNAATRVEPMARSVVASTVSCISSDTLLAGANEVHIEHRGSLYRLRQTSLGKLILTK